MAGDGISVFNNEVRGNAGGEVGEGLVSLVVHQVDVVPNFHAVGTSRDVVIGRLRARGF